MLARSLPRFLLEAGFLIVAAAIAAVIHLGAAAIVIVMAAAFAIVVVGEWVATREVAEKAAPARRTPPPLTMPPASKPPVPLRPRPVPAAVVSQVPPAPAWPKPSPPPAASPAGERRWNVFELQSRAREVAGANPARDDEVSFLLVYLREFADVEGDLSIDFDNFVRESFPELIGA